ncbi:LPS-assembly protein LptD [Desulfogranum japonicum]|uniref:LPS-assembly protein LptD n=1 Tax=Desulfogranum japonicum TaxID=231447 RepID=UPI0003F54D4F|nr:LPS assembly protein LptD [Desulfogranum japonicum]
MKQYITRSPILNLLLVFVVCSSAGEVCAESVDALQWEITADKLTRYEDPPSIIAEGNVVLEKREAVTRAIKKESAGWADLLGEDAAEPEEQGEENVVTTTKVLTKIKSDWMVYDVDLGRVKARGNLLIDIGPDQLAADSGVVNLNEETGTFEGASIIREYKDMHIEGKVIEKTGDLTYHIEDGWIITCKLKDDETAPWSFAAADTEITDGGYAYLKHATFRIKGIPVLYTPYMILPAKRQRQTGFLFPSMSYSDRDGFGVELPFFINLSPSSDLTLYPYFMAERGVMVGAEFRYMVDVDDKGMIMGNYLSDELSDPSETEYYTETGYQHTNQSRYWVRAKADQDIGDWTSRLDIDLVSDQDYLLEFDSGNTGYDNTEDRFQEIFGRGFENDTNRYRTNSFKILRSFDNGTSLQGDVVIIDDISEAETIPSKLWKLPGLTYTGLVPLYDGSSVDFSWDADYVNYYREEGVGAHRFDLHPQLSTSLPLSQYLETTVTAGVRDTFYGLQVNGDTTQSTNGEGTAVEFEDGDTENRLLADFNAEIGTTMIGEFDTFMGSETPWTHTFRPYVEYNFVSDADQDEIPYMDSTDTIADESTIYYGTDNYFTVFSGPSGNLRERNYGYFKIYQGYSLLSEDEDEPLTPVYINLGYYPLPNMWLKYKTRADVYADGFYWHSVEAAMRSNRGDYLSATYKFNDASNTESVSGDAWLVLPYNFYFGYELSKSLSDDITVEENVRLVYQPACWSVELLSNYSENDHKYLVVFRLANIGNPFGVHLPN